MKFELNELNLKNCIDINEIVTIDSNIDKRIHDLKDSKVIGKITKNSNGDIYLDCVFEGIMYIDDAITLESVPYKFNINIEENLEDLEENYQDCYQKEQNILDLKQILWQNIVLEVPIGFTLCNDANIKGNGWELINENTKVDEIDPRFKKLEDLLKGDD